MIIRALQKIIALYCWLISPLLGQNCRFTPSCSHYAHQALEKHGFFKGLLLIIRRILSCAPWGRRDQIDPVPEHFTWRDMVLYKHDQSDKTSDRKN